MLVLAGVLACVRVVFVLASAHANNGQAGFVSQCADVISQGGARRKYAHIVAVLVREEFRLCRSSSRKYSAIIAT